ncbi:hypothetical protein D3C80_1894980 [compost metagenome]
MEQHALLHRRQRVDVFDIVRRYRQAIQISLGQTRQREVDRCQCRLAQAVLDQLTQDALITTNQSFVTGHIVRTEMQYLASVQ